MIQQQYKKVAQMPEKECVMQFLSLVWSFYKYDEEQFKCSIGVRYNIYILFRIWKRSIVSTTMSLIIILF